jgi:diguanylate cyclase (GGDEF)-like protein
MVCSLLTILGFTAVCVTVMIDMRHGEEQIARQTLENLATTIDSEISRNIEMYDLSLRAVVNNIASPEIDSVSRELRNLILFDNAASARHFGGIQVFNASGNLTIDAASLDPAPLNVEREEFFRYHRSRPAGALYISRPAIVRGTYAIVLSRRINDRNGEFGGVVAGTIRLSYFHSLFSRLRLGENDTITVMRPDGIVIMRTPFDIGYIGRDVSAVPGVAQALKEPSGSVSGVSALDGLARLFVWRSSEQPLIVFVGKPWGAIHAMWNKQAIWVGSVMAFLVAMAALMTLFLTREIARRGRAEESLEGLATTDGLTGLSNRRKFDRELDLEWRRAARSHESVALLMIDADRFKAYNDLYGHQAGDKALMAVASCIAEFANRPGDCAARYGGEEFALLLPSVRLPEAMRIADTLRERAAACLDDPAPVTVSIGVATLSADSRIAPEILVALADRALYEAKRSGRNRCRAAGASSEEIAA